MTKTHSIASRSLDEIRSVFGLTEAALAALLGVNRSTLIRWRKSGVSIERSAHVDAVVHASRALRAFFRPEVLQQIVTEPIPGLGGHSILEIAKVEPRRIVELVEATRSYIPRSLSTAELVSAHELDVIRSVFGLSETSLAKVFSVSRYTINRWRKLGIPTDRGADVNRIAGLAECFRRRFSPERIPEIVRTPGRGLGEKTVIDILLEGDIERVYAYLEELFSYTPRESKRDDVTDASN